MTSSQIAVTESLLSKMCSSIWTEEQICVEEKHLKKQWFVRNGQETHKTENFERPLLTLVVKNVKKKNVCFGPVVQVASTPFYTGKGKNKEKQEGLSFLALWKGEGFVSIIVDPKEFDMDTTGKYPTDVVTKEVIAAAQNDSFTNDWFQSYVSDSEAYLLPMVQAEYEARSGAPWRNPLKRTLKIRTPVSKSTSTTGSPSTARGSRTKEQQVPANTLVGRSVTATTGPTPTNHNEAEGAAAIQELAQILAEAAEIPDQDVPEDMDVLEAVGVPATNAVPAVIPAAARMEIVA